MSSIEKTPETQKKACLAVYCNGWKECNDCNGVWCEWHPKYNGRTVEEVLHPLIEITGCRPETLGIKGKVIWSGTLADPFEEMLDKEYKWSGESIFEPISIALNLWFNLARAMKRAAERCI